MNWTFFKELLSIDSTSGKEREVAEWLLTQLEAPVVEPMEVGDGTLNLFLKWGTPKVVFCTHMDTVPPYIAPGFPEEIPLRGTPFASLSPAPPTADAAGPSPYPCAGVHMSSEGSGTCLVTLSAGVVFDDFCAWAAAEGLWGPENLSLIPGEVGASAVQNIGAYGVEAKDIIAEIRAYDRTTGQFVAIDPATCAYGYRTSKFKTEWKGRFVITAVTYRLSRTPQPKLDYGGVRKALENMGVSMGSQTHGHPRPCKREGPTAACR